MFILRMKTKSYCFDYNQNNYFELYENNLVFDKKFKQQKR